MHVSSCQTSPAAGAGPHIAMRRGVSVLAILASLLIVALAVIAGASTWVALRASEERNRAKEDFAAARLVIDQYVKTIATGNELKGSSQAAARQALYQPAIDYYQKFVQTHENDPNVWPQMAEAYYHLAGLHAKQGSKEASGMLGKGLSYINRMKLADADPATFPSLEQCALKYTLPTEWVTLRGASAVDQRANLAPLVVNFDNANLTFEELSEKHPQTVTFRDDLAAIQRIPATLFGFAGLNDRAIKAWQRASDALATCVRDRPDNLDYKVRLAEALSALASRQRSAGKIEDAVANYQRTVEVREQIVAANPDDKTRQQELTTTKRDLDRAKSATTKSAKKETPAAEKAAETPAPETPTSETPTVETPAKTPATEPAAEAPSPTEPPAEAP